MSFKEVTALRKSSNLEAAIELARADLRKEQSEWTYSALFWVLNDYCKLYISQNHVAEAKECLDEMNNLLENMLDNEGIAERTVSSLRKRIIPNRELVYNMSELSKAGNVEEAYNRLVEVHKNTPLDPALHEDFGWVIFRYLNNKYEEIGSLNSRKALHCYINLENERPSRLHSQMLNLATKISEKYEDFKFLPFLDMWNVCSFSHEDFMSTDWNGKTISPLVDRIIERCFNLRYSLSDVENSFKDNPGAEKRIIDVFSRANFFKISKLYNDDLFQLLKCIDLYIEAIKGKEIKNEYHSKILSILIKKLPENRTVEFIDFLNEWGMLNFQEKDWIREKVDDKEYQSLVEKAISLYINALKIRKYQNVNEQFVILLQEAIKYYPDNDQLERYMALILLAQGEKEKALDTYRKLILKLNRFYVWKELAEATDDRELKVSALCKAILSEPKDDFLGEVHLALAKLLIEDNLLDIAKGELVIVNNTYQRNEWKPKEEYSSLRKLIPDSVQASSDNTKFYSDHQLPADEFVYSDIEWTTMVVSDVYTLKKEGKEMKKARLVSAEGVELSVRLKTLKEKGEKVLGLCYDVKILTHGDKYEVGLIRKSEKVVSDLLSSVVCYVDFFNKEKKCYHLVSQKNNQLTLSQNVELKEGMFCSCYVFPQKKKEDDRPARALFIKVVERDDAVTLFPAKTAVVDHINEAKQLFHCVFGRGMDIIVRFSETTLRPHIGDYVRIIYIWKKLKDGRIIRKMLHLEQASSCDLVLKKTVKGSIRMNINSRGQQFGFVDNYYIPSYLIKEVEENDNVEVDVVYNGEKWEAYQLRVIS